MKERKVTYRNGKEDNVYKWRKKEEDRNLWGRKEMIEAKCEETKREKRKLPVDMEEK